MPEITPQEDLLQDTDLRTATYRPELLPGWFKFCWGIIIFYNVRELISVPGLIRQIYEADETTQVILAVTYFIYILTSIALIVVRFLFHKQAGATIKVAIPVMITALCLGLIAILSICFGDTGGSPVSHFWIVVHEIALTATLIHTFRIRKKWSEASKID